MSRRLVFFCLVLALGMPLLANPLVFVGSYQVDSGPFWATNPLSYSAREAAAIVFGGVSTDYQISINPDTVDPGTITFTGWYSVWGIPGGAEFAQDYSLQTGTGYNDPGGASSAASAYVTDNAIGATYTNYVWQQSAFSAEAPEPATMWILGTGLVGLAALRRRRTSVR